MILHVRHGEKRWWLVSRDGKRTLGQHATRAKAEAQERAIQISKARRAGYRIPRAATPGRRRARGTGGSR